MPLVLRTLQDHPEVTIAGVGKLPANGIGGRLLDVMAGSLRELQDDDGNPLEGDELKAAAEAFAEQRGYDVADISADKAARLDELAGAPAPRPPLADVAQRHPAARFAATAGAQLRGKALDDELDRLGLSKAGTADEKRARLTEAELAAATPPDPTA